MACFSPLTASQLVTGEVVFFARQGMDILRELKLPCGQCIGCRLERSRQWAVRIMHEAQMHEFNCFITLTYDDDHLPTSLSLQYDHFQKFMKRVRKKFSCFDVVSWQNVPRFFACGEYGEQFHRPHFHACVFGLFFNDRVFNRSLDSGARLYTSATLEKLWPHGFSSVGDLTFQSAAYVARYVTKKVTGPNAEEHYKVVDWSTGELSDRVPEFAHMSLKPGIGARWFEKYKKEVYPNDQVVMNGVSMKPPKYYDKLLELDGTLLPDEVEYRRYQRAMEIPPEENMEDRLRVRETVARARVSQLRRGLS